MSRFTLPTDGIFVSAQIFINEGVDVKIAKKRIADFCQQMCDEPGCRFAIATQNQDDERTLHLWENYENSAAIESHFSAPHMQAFIALGMTTLLKATQSSAI